MTAADTSTGTLPLFHVGGTISGALCVFIAGAELLIMSPAGLRNPAMVQGFWRLVAQYGATRVGAVPTSIGAVLDVPADGADLAPHARRLHRRRVAAAGRRRALPRKSPAAR